MKKSTAKLFCIILVILLTGCGTDNASETKVTAGEKEEVVSSASVAESISAEISEEMPETEEEGAAENIEKVDAEQGTDGSEIELLYNKFGFSTSDNDEAKVYYDTICKIELMDDYEVQGYELAYIDGDEIPELIVSVFYYGRCLYFYTVKAGEVVPYYVGDEWMNTTDPLGTDISNSIDLGHGNGYQTKELSYLPRSGTFYYYYSEESFYGEEIAEYYFDGNDWGKVREAGCYYADENGNTYESDSNEVESGLASKKEYDYSYVIPGYDAKADWKKVGYDYVGLK